jgi:hypothetical protein
MNEEQLGRRDSNSVSGLPSRIKKDVENLRVAVRLRPLRDDLGEQPAFRAENSKVLEIAASEGDAASWPFDFVFDAQTPTSTVYEVIGRPMIARGLEGFNGTIFAYGSVNGCCCFLFLQCSITDIVRQ